ncbi:MAG: glycosyltransferase family 4 protein, partial [Bacteroidales bacterium]|nr:glycosyltransferase family 4 protein [Bacteroidales bacterium]
NILLINYEFPPLGAGASTATYHIGKELVAMGHDISVLTSGYKGITGFHFKEGMHVYRCPALRKKKSESNIIEMMSFVISAFILLPWIIIKRKTKGVIVFFSFPCGPLGLWANILFGIPYIISLRGGDVPGNEKRLDRIHNILKPLRKIIYKKSKAVVANSHGLKKLAQKADSFPMSVIPNGIDSYFFKPLETDNEQKKIHFIFTGRLSEQKNLFYMFEQFASLKKISKKNLMIHMAGDGPLKGKLEIFAKDLGISDNIVWYGWVNKNRILKLYQKADCFVNPSFCEGMPNSVLEAMACGLPVLASNVPGNNDIVFDGENGFLFNLDDHRKIKDSLNMIIENPNICSKLGKNARKRIKDEFSWNKAADAYSGIFNK